MMLSIYWIGKNVGVRVLVKGRENLDVKVRVHLPDFSIFGRRGKYIKSAFFDTIISRN